MSTEDILARIDEALGCQQCGKKLRENGPSPDFCGEPCQAAWHSKGVSTRLLAERDYGSVRGWPPDVRVDVGPVEYTTFGMDEIARLYSVPVPLLRIEPIKLTRQQFDRLLDVCGPADAHVVGALAGFDGVPVQVVATEAESTPYLERWPAFDRAGSDADRAELLDPPDLVITLEPDTSELDRQMGWLSRWFRRHR